MPPVHQGLSSKNTWARVGQLFLIVTQGREKQRPFVKRVDKTVVRADKKQHFRTKVIAPGSIFDVPPSASAPTPLIARNPTTEKKWRGPSFSSFSEIFRFLCKKFLQVAIKYQCISISIQDSYSFLVTVRFNRLIKSKSARLFQSKVLYYNKNVVENQHSLFSAGH